VNRSRVWTVLSLVIVCVVAAVALAQVYGVTKSTIEKQAADALESSLRSVLPAAATFEEAESATVWLGRAADGSLAGIVFKVAPRGYGGPVPVVVGLDTAARVIAVSVGAGGMKETPGLGMKAQEEWFRVQFAGKAGDEVKLKRDGGTVDAISAATITSRAVASGVREGIEKYAHHLRP
jgi:electron transport complex protein RnfG